MKSQVIYRKISRLYLGLPTRHKTPIYPKYWLNRKGGGVTVRVREKGRGVDRFRHDRLLAELVRGQYPASLIPIPPPSRVFLAVMVSARRRQGAWWSTCVPNDRPRTPPCPAAAWGSGWRGGEARMTRGWGGVIKWKQNQ